MKTRLVFLCIALMMCQFAISQANLNNYKYVIVPNKFDFLKEENQYKVNALTQFLFKKYGFEAFMEGDDYPNDMRSNRCLALKSNVTKESGLFKTKLRVILKDCNDQVVYTSQLGESREKDYAKSYHEALRNAFMSFEGMGYRYDPDASVSAAPVVTQPTEEKRATAEEIAELKAEIESLKKEKEKEVVEVPPVAKTPPVAEVPPVVEVAPVVEETRQEIKEEVVQEEKAPEPEATDAEPSKNILYAQAIENGFQLVDSTPKVVYKLIRTGVSNVFLVEGLSAIVYKDGDTWIVEQHSGDTSIKAPLNIKF
ncbi:hypothetical protein [Aestuariivivens sediminicola]|uniref:hypothetical protein n=1 Tax=Aestuariivivens sediminicola TaxID=2913560 RepID=UPI001F57ECE0|nr:hypothetical protein [Aestuariivivens sediminicola]